MLSLAPTEISLKVNEEDSLFEIEQSGPNSFLWTYLTPVAC